MAEAKKKTEQKTEKKSEKKPNSAKNKKNPAKKSTKEPAKEPVKKSRPKQPSMPALEEPPPEKEPAEQEKTEVPSRIYSVCLFAAGILITLLILVQGSAMWKVMHELIKGLFGISSVGIPIGLFWTALQIDRKKDKDTLSRQLRFFALTIIFFSCFMEVMIWGGRILDYDFFGCFAMLRKEGIAWHGGGMISVTAYPIQAIFGEIGAKIMMCLLLFVYIMLSTKKTLSEMLELIHRPFQELSDFIREDKQDRNLVDRYEQEQLVHEQQNEQEALAIAEQVAMKSLPEEETNFLIDVPVSNTAVKQDEEGKSEFFELPVKETKAKTRGKSQKKEAESTENEDEQLTLLPSLEELIANAAQKPKKKEPEEWETIPDISDETEQQTVQDLPQIYQIPSTELLEQGISHENDPHLKQELRDNANQLCEVLKSFNVEVNITNIARGPSVTRYEVQPAPGVKVSKITSLSDDIALNLAAEGVRIEAPIPGKPAVGIEVANSRKDMVCLRELLESPAFRNAKSKLTFAVGKDIAGNVIIGDIARMPHMIIAGATGSGKSVCTNSIIMSILYHAAPDEVKLILIDPKIVEFRIYNDIPHLLIPVVTDPKKAAGALNWAVQEMLRRYEVFADCSAKNLEDYNRICIEKPEKNLQKLPQIVICIDELADLMMTASKEVEEAICRLAQLARAAGMHLIIATQRPTTDIITGLIKANIPSRIALSVMSQIDSRIILDMGGAEKLLGHGDMLYLPNGQLKPVRVQGCYVSTQEIEKVVEFIKEQPVSEIPYDEEIDKEVERMAVSSDKKKNHSASEDTSLNGDADLIEQAIEVIVSAGQASTSSLQRRLRLGYARAARIMDELEEMGIIGPSEGAKPRKVLMSPLQLEERKMHQKGE